MSNIEEFFTVKVITKFSNAEALEEELFALGALSTQVINTPSKFSIEAEDEVEILAFFPPDENLQEKISNHLLNIFDDIKIFFEFIANENWQQRFVTSCKTFKIEPCIYIVPSFEIDDFKKNHQEELFIEMDPQNAFGTGRHETTKLCLAAIYEYLHQKPKEFFVDAKGLDVGCGSGILAILMGKMGIKNILATDIDEFALKTAEENFTKNNIAAFATLVDEEYTYKTDTFDLVVANILALPLKNMAENLCSCLKKNGHLILSGLLKEQAEEIKSIYIKNNLNFLKMHSDGDWICLEFAK